MISPLNYTKLVKSRPIFKILFSVESFIKYWMCSCACLAPSSTTPDPVLASHDLTTYHLLRTFSSPCYSCTTFSSAIIFRRSSRHRKHLSLPIPSIHCTILVFHNIRGVDRYEIVVGHYVIKPSKSGGARAPRPHLW